MVQKFCGLIDQFTDITGKAVAWLTLALILATCGVVVLRYFLGTGSIALQESITYLHAGIFMLGIAYTLKRGGHVRVDVFYRNFSPRLQSLVDVLGGLLFLIPVCVLLLVLCWNYVGSSWSIRETSSEGSGLPYVYLLKSLMLLLPATLLLQGMAETLKNILFFAGRGGSHTQEKLEHL